MKAIFANVTSLGSLKVYSYDPIQIFRSHAKEKGINFIMSHVVKYYL